MRRNFSWVLIILPILYITSYFIRDQIPFHADTAWNIFAIQRWFWNQVTATGEWPLWNEYLFNGYSYFGSPTHEVFSPLVTPFYLLLPSFWPAIATITLALIIAMVGTYKFAKLFIDNHYLCIIAAIAYGFLGPTLSLIDRSTILCSVALYPWIALLTYQITIGFNLKKSILWGLLVSASIHHLDWAGTVAAVGLSFCIAVTLPAIQRRQMFYNLIIGVIFLFLFSAPLLLPIYENLPYTNRATGLSYSENSEWSLNPIRVVQQVIPEIWGNSYNKTFWGHQFITGHKLTRRFWFHSLYLSIPILLLAFVSLWSQRRKPLTWIMAGCSVFLFLLSLGPNFFLHPWMFEHVSALAKFRYPEKFVLFPILILFAYSIKALPFYVSANRQWLIKFWSSITAIHILAPIILLFYLPSDFFNKTSTNVASAIEVARYQHFFLAVLGATFVFFLFRRKSLNTQVALGIFITADLLFFSPALKTTSWSEYTDHVRFTEDQQLAQSTGRWAIDTSNLIEADGRQILVKDWGPLANLRILTAYDAILPSRLPKSLSDVFDHLPNWSNAINLEYILTADQPRHSVLKELQNKNLLQEVYKDPKEKLVVLKTSRTAEEFSFVQQAKLVSSEEDSLKALRESSDLTKEVILEEQDQPQQWIASSSALSNMATSLEVVTHTNNQRKILLRNPQPGWLVFRQSYHPGWQAFVDGQNTPIFHGNYAAMAIPIKNQDNKELQIELSFSSPGFKLGLYLFLLAVIFAFAVTLKSRLGH